MCSNFLRPISYSALINFLNRDWAIISTFVLIPFPLLYSFLNDVPDRAGRTWASTAATASAGDVSGQGAKCMVSVSVGLIVLMSSSLLYSFGALCQRIFFPFSWKTFQVHDIESYPWVHKSLSKVWKTYWHSSMRGKISHPNWKMKNRSTKIRRDSVEG